MQQPIPQPAAPKGRYAFPALIAGNLVLALGPWMVRIADVGPVAAGFWRMGLAVPLLLLLARHQAGPRIAPNRGLVVLLSIAGLFFAADLAVWHVGIRMTTLANASLFGNSSSLFLVVYGFLRLKRLPRPIQWLAIASAAIGAGLLLGSSWELSPRNFTGDLFTMLAGLFYTFYLIVVDRTRREMKPMPVLAIATTAGALPLLLMAWLVGDSVVPHDWTPLVVLALGSQVIGQGLVVYGVGYLSPVVVGVGLLTQPVGGAIIGRLAYGETMSAADIAGAMLIAASLILIRLPERAGRLASTAARDHS
ncbi:MAG TPA: DMT family transporter [Allosphingosinicella sp.]|nr:DMT family transporter [Allosphingosinicella sp.]